jgi:hypothetical protein
MIMMATIQIANVPESFVSMYWYLQDYSQLSFDGMDYCFWDAIIPTKKDKIAWLQWQIDILNGGTIDAREFLESLVNNV